MKHYDFEVLRGGTVIVAERSIVLAELAAVWSKIAEMARAVEEPGCKVRVKDQAGRNIILVGGFASSERKPSTRGERRLLPKT